MESGLRCAPIEEERMRAPMMEGFPPARGSRTLPREPGAGEVHVPVQASSLNGFDLMAAGGG